MPPRQAPSDSPAPNALAIAVGAAASAAAAGAPPAAGGAATIGSIIAAKKLLENATKAIMAVVRRLSKLRLVRARAALVSTVAPGADIDAVLRGEREREGEFQRRATARVRSGLKLAFDAPDPSVRSAAIEAVARREQQYARHRAQASGERLFASVEREALRTTSPQGAFWELGPTTVHTPDCLAMQGKFWPWEILDRIHPPMHVGCKCRLRSYGEALASGVLTPSAIPDLATARRLAAGVISWVEAERASENAAVAELLVREELASRRAVDPDILAAMPLKVDEDFGEAEVETRAMVALFPDPKEAVDLALKGGTAPEDLHVTLAFLGTTRGRSLEKAKAAVSSWAKKTPPLKGKMSGVGHFDVGKDGVVTYRSVDLPELPTPRENLVKALDAAGVPPNRVHGFSPHMTIDEKLRRPEVEATPITFRSVTLAWGGEHHSYPLAGNLEEAKDSLFREAVERRQAEIDAVMVPADDPAEG